MLSRRQFLKLSAAVGAGLALPVKLSLQVPAAFAFAQSAGLRKFKDLAGNPLPFRLLPPVMTSDGKRKWGKVTATHYTIGIQQLTDQLHPDLPNPTRLWGFGQGSNFKHLGGIIVAQKGTPVQITFQNNLPPTHILPVDIDPFFPDAATNQNKTSVHLHGGHTPWITDGGPFDWWAPNGDHGVSFLNNQVLNPGAAPNEAEYYYPNDSSARLQWYHDHSHDTTRLNAYAGIASGYVIRDSFELNLVNQGLPNFIEKGGREIPIIIQDKIFVSPTTAVTDPTWFDVVQNSHQGDLWYAHVYERDRWTLQATAKTLPDPSVIAEFFGDTMLANGSVYPEATVEARRYRLRILNACNARFLNLQLFVDDGSPDGITMNLATLTPTNAPYNPASGTGLAPFSCLQIGTEGGFLPHPVNVPLNVPFNPLTFNGSLLLGPAERADVIIDFTGYEGKKLILYGDAPAPFPSGDPRNDYFPGAPKNPTQPTPGFGPNTRQIMRFNVVPATGTDSPLGITTSTDLTAGNDPLLAPLGVTTPPVGIFARQLTLNETFDALGRLIQLLGTNVAAGPGTFGRAYEDPATETPRAGTIEVWQLANLTGDTHPIHFHLVNVQILSRQPFKVNSYSGTPSFTGPARPPDPNEVGWKETVRMNPGEVTTVITQFNLPAVPFTVPTSPRTGGLEYVWHCHILEHEEHDMMRPLVVLP